MRKLAKNYYKSLLALFDCIRVTDKKGHVLDFYEGIEKTAGLIMSRTGSGRKIMFVGNGASAAISSHISTDFWKNGGVKAVAFNDPSLLTCVSNDFGYRHVFEKPIEMFGDKGDILFAISSSGKSENILRAVRSARLKGCDVITLSGFKKDNPLSFLGDFNFYAPLTSYGPVEIAHHSICHCLVDIIIKKKNGQV